MRDVGIDRGFEFAHRRDGQPAQPPGGQLTEEPFHQVEPRREGRCEMEMCTGMALEPAIDLGRFDLRLFVDGQHQCAVRGIHIEPYDIAHLLDDQPILKVSLRGGLSAEARQIRLTVL